MYFLLKSVKNAIQLTPEFRRRGGFWLQFYASGHILHLLWTLLLRNQENIFFINI